MGGAEWCWETAREVAGTAILVSSVAAGLAVLGWRKRALLVAALFTRFTRDDAGAHPTRARLLGEVRSAPGASTAGLARALGLNEGTALYHLRVLERSGLAKSLAVGRERQWFEAGMRAADEPSHARRRVLDAIEAAPGSTLTEVARGVGVAKSTAHHHVAALAKEGRVEPARTGRTLRLYPGRRDD